MDLLHTIKRKKKGKTQINRNDEQRIVAEILKQQETKVIPEQ
jgi:hypothetical protein